MCDILETWLLGLHLVITVLLLVLVQIDLGISVLDLMCEIMPPVLWLDKVILVHIGRVMVYSLIRDMVNGSLPPLSLCLIFLLGRQTYMRILRGPKTDYNQFHEFGDGALCVRFGNVSL